MRRSTSTPKTYSSPQRPALPPISPFRSPGFYLPLFPLPTPPPGLPHPASLPCICLSSTSRGPLFLLPPSLHNQSTTPPPSLARPILTCPSLLASSGSLASTDDRKASTYKGPIGMNRKVRISAMMSASSDEEDRPQWGEEGEKCGADGRRP